MTQTGTEIMAHLDTLTTLDELIAAKRHQVAAGRGSQKLANERQLVLTALLTQRREITKTLPVGVLKNLVTDSHYEFMAHKGAGKAQAIARRWDNLVALKAVLVTRQGLDEEATDSDLLDVALERTTVAQINNRLAAVLAED